MYLPTTYIKTAITVPKYATKTSPTQNYNKYYTSHTNRNYPTNPWLVYKTSNGHGVQARSQSPPNIIYGIPTMQKDGRCRQMLFFTQNKGKYDQILCLWYKIGVWVNSIWVSYVWVSYMWVNGIWVSGELYVCKWYVSKLCVSKLYGEK